MNLVAIHTANDLALQLEAATDLRDRFVLFMAGDPVPAKITIATFPELGDSVLDGDADIQGDINTKVLAILNANIVTIQSDLDDAVAAINP